MIITSESSTEYRLPSAWNQSAHVKHFEILSGLRNLVATSLSLSGSALSFAYVVHEILDDCQADTGGEPQDGVADDIEITLKKAAAAVNSLFIPLLPNEKKGTTFSFQVG